MNKQAFMEALGRRLSGLPEGERVKSLEYYAEMIGDRVEEGMDEEEAVAALGGMDDIVESVMYAQSLPTLLQAKVNGRRRAGGARWALILCGSPLWLPVLLALACAALAVYIAIWAVIAALYAVLIALGIAGVCGFAGGIVICCTKSLQVGLCIIGGALVCGALTLLAGRLVPWLTKRLIALTVRALRGIKSLLIEKEEEAE